ncbi:ParA family protein [Neotabrizicola shimadae]|uniref:AAA family ATPase n=1 Tax=Neotabrizicola shimadae TaxID=2807096 RepID=A0A8G0ZTU7_9RHOB|nr:AAA family ATPase [Neotabrizicola shimadae]QYZ70008.1 AAA family ATPase [Neotabrizicola shimadae]
MKVIACYSNKGGVGKTATAVNLAYALASHGQRVLLCDLDPQGAAGFYFRVKPSQKLSGKRFFGDAERLARAIRGSDYDGLDILPSNQAFRDFDVLLSRLKSPQSRLKRALAALDHDYDVILLDCPPGLSTLSENVFRASDALVVPVIPTTLSQRSLRQLMDFFRDNDMPTDRLIGLFSMVQTGKRLHKDIMTELRQSQAPLFLSATIQSSAEVERMGLERAPVAAVLPAASVSKAYAAAALEICDRLGL